MKNLRRYGKAPFRVAVIHGGPGAAGEMAPVARELATERGVLEPLQTAATLEGQLAELNTVLARNAGKPVTLIGFSWGAWLSFNFAARYPTRVNKLILIGSGSYEEKFAEGIQQTRLNRLNAADRAEVEALFAVLTSPVANDKNRAFARFGRLLSIADAYDPISSEAEAIDYRVEIFEPVWQEAAGLRRSGKLVELGKQLRCPVTAIHGDYDPHLAEGVQQPLSEILQSFHFILLNNCGHKPWIERQARGRFYTILREELRSVAAAELSPNFQSPAQQPR